MDSNWLEFVERLSALENQSNPLAIDADPDTTTFVYQKGSEDVAFIGHDAFRGDIVILSCLDRLDPGKEMSIAILQENALVLNSQDRVLAYLPKASGITCSVRVKLGSLEPEGFWDLLDRMLDECRDLEERLEGVGPSPHDRRNRDKDVPDLETRTTSDDNPPHDEPRTSVGMAQGIATGGSTPTRK